MRTPSPAPAIEAPVYVPASAVAQACGVNLLDLENRHRPADWAAPRDFTFTRRGVLYAEASLPKFVVSLETAGLTGAAERLRGYIAALSRKPAAYTDELPLKPVERADASMAELDRMNAHVARRHRSDIESARFEWENE
jgi:hypothetical protein